MNNKKCPNCGFINFVTAHACRKCETFLDAMSNPEPVDSGQHSSLGAYQNHYVVLPPKAKAGFPVFKVLLLLVLVGIVVSALAGGGISGLTGHREIVWKELHTKHGSLVVMMPGDPLYEQNSTSSPLGAIGRHIFTSEVPGQGACMYVVVDSNIKPPFEPAPEKFEEGLETELNRLASSTKSTLVSKSHIRMGGNPGLEFELRPPPFRDMPNPRAFGKMFMTPDHVYLLLVTASEGSDLLKTRGMFLNLKDN